MKNTEIAFYIFRICGKCPKDIDEFTLINKVFGYTAGNEILRAIFYILNDIIGNDYVYGWGADEFFCIVKNCSEERAFKIADQILYCTEKYLWHEIAPNLYVKISIGIASLSRKKNEATVDWMERSILGCMYAKKDGGNNAKRGPVIPGPSRTEKKKNARYS